jgi:hypothetical protein
VAYKYREHLHDFKAAVAGYSGAGLVIALVIHAIVFSSPIGDPTLKHVMLNLGVHY